MAMVKRILVLVILSAGLTHLAHADESFRFAAALWGCEGEVRIHLQETVEDVSCKDWMTKELPPGSRLTVQSGWAQVTDPSGSYRKLKPGEAFEVPSPQRRLGEWTGFFKNLIPLAGAVAKLRVLRGDEFPPDLSQLPWLEISNGDRTRVASWSGVVVWRNLPLDHPLILRIWAGQDLVYGPVELTAPAFDLARLAEQDPETVTIELLVGRSSMLPSPSFLALPLGRLLNLPGKPIAVVLQTPLDRVDEATLEREGKLLDQAQVELPPLGVASLAFDLGRLDIARQALEAVAVPAEQPALWRTLASGFQIFGDASILTGSEEPIPVSPRCDGPLRADLPLALAPASHGASP